MFLSLQVRGVVKAEIIDSQGNSYTVSRTIESLKKLKKFKTLDSTVTRVSKDKKEVSIYLLYSFCKIYFYISFLMCGLFFDSLESINN